MPVGPIIAIFNGISLGLLGIGGAAVALTLSAAGLCTMFSWLDMHIGGFVKRVFTSVLLGGTMMGGGGALGVWLSSQLALTAAGPTPAVPAAPAGMILGLFGLV